MLKLKRHGGSFSRTQSLHFDLNRFTRFQFSAYGGSHRVARDCGRGAPGFIRFDGYGSFLTRDHRGHHNRFTRLGIVDDNAYAIIGCCGSASRREHQVASSGTCPTSRRCAGLGVGRQQDTVDDRPYPDRRRRHGPTCEDRFDYPATGVCRLRFVIGSFPVF